VVAGASKYSTSSTCARFATLTIFHSKYLVCDYSSTGIQGCTITCPMALNGPISLEVAGRRKYPTWTCATVFTHPYLGRPRGEEWEEHVVVQAMAWEPRSPTPFFKPSLGQCEVSSHQKPPHESSSEATKLRCHSQSTLVKDHLFTK
jgi:hypothetical protein